MPFDVNKPLGGGQLGISQYDEPPPSYIETIGAWMRQDNPVVSGVVSAKNGVDFNRVDPAFDPYTPENITGYEKYADRFERVYNADAMQAVKTDIDRELKDRETQAKSGLIPTMLGMGAAIAMDPTILLPGGALVRAGQVGYRTGRTAASVGGAAAIAAGASELALQASQETRTVAESAMVIGGSAILGGLVGVAGAKFFSKAEWDRVGASLREQLAEEVPNPAEVTDAIVQRMQSVGAASVDDVSLEDLGIGGGRAAQIVAKATEAARINPGIQTMFSPSKKVREVYTQMVDNPVYSRMNMEGRTIGPDVENLVKEYTRGRLGQWVAESRSLWREARKAGFEGTRSDFLARVARAGRRGDVDEFGNEQVTRLAQKAREQVFDPLLERAIRAGLLPEDVKVTTAASYVTRLWNRQRLIGEEGRFRQIAGDYFRREIMKVPPDQRVDFVNKADMDDYIEEIVTSVFNNLTGRGKGDVPDWLVPTKRGPLKERTFNIPDELVEDFLENDMELILRRYSRVMAAEVELTEKFGRADMKDQIEAISKEYDDLSKKAASPAERERLNQLRARDIGNLEAFRDMIRGTYRAAEEGTSWSKMTRAALAWNYMRLLGGVTLTSLTDATRIVGVHGVRAAMKEGLPALLSGVKAAKIARREARELGAVTEVVLQSRLATLADLQDPYRYGSSFERFLSNSTNIFSKATGLAYWNDGIKTVASVMTQNRIARNAVDWAKAGERERAYMAMLGIDENMAERIASQLKKFGVEERGIYGANASEWTDELARRTWAAALNKDVDRTIITKGVADTPLWMKTNWGKLAFQFKSFAMASHQRVLIAGLQERPHRLAEQMVFGTALGMMISWLKYVERGDTDEADRLLENPGLWISDGLDRTGILSLPYEASNTLEKVGMPFGFTTAAQAIAGDPDQGGTVSRYTSRGKFGAVGGPSVSLFEDLATIAEQLSRGDLKKSGANAIIRQVPGASLPGVRTAIHVGIKPELQEAVE